MGIIIDPFKKEEPISTCMENPIVSDEITMDKMEKAFKDAMHTLPITSLKKIEANPKWYEALKKHLPSEPYTENDKDCFPVVSYSGVPCFEDETLEDNEFKMTFKSNL